MTDSIRRVYSVVSKKQIIRAIKWDGFTDTKNILIELNLGYLFHIVEDGILHVLSDFIHEPDLIIKKDEWIIISLNPTRIYTKTDCAFRLDYIFVGHAV